MRYASRSIVALALVAGLGAGPVTPALAAAATAPASATSSWQAASTTASTSAASAGVLITLEDGALGAGLLSDDAAGATASGLSELGLSITDQTESPDGSVTLVATAPAGMSDEEAAAAASQVEGVAAAQPNYLYDVIGEQEPSGEAPQSLAQGLSLLWTVPVNDPLTAVSSTTDSEGKAIKNQYWAYQSSLVEAWTDALAAQGGRTPVTLAVFDTGARFDHEDLRENLLTDLAWDSTTGTALTASATFSGDVQGHGTHVAGIAAAVANNSVGLAGASLGAKVLPVKVVKLVTENGKSKWKATSASLTAAYNYLFGLIDSGAASNVRVVNISLGGHGDDMNDVALRSAIAKARNSYGILTVCAGGNDHGADDVANADGSDKYIYPGDFPESLSVTSLTTGGATYTGAEYNDAKDISAPGESIWSTWKDGKSSYTSQNGTSMASPIVAGAAALFFSVHPNATPDDVQNALRATATKVADQPAQSGSAGALDAAEALNALDAALPLSDIYTSAWYYDDVLFAYNKCIMTGYSGTTEFRPYGDLNRAEMAQLLYNYLGNGEKCPAAPLADVDQNQYYADAVNWAVAKGYMTGYGDGSGFGPWDALTREQTAVIFARLSTGSAEPAGTSMDRFYAMPDTASTSFWAQTAMAWALNKGVLTGVQTGSGYELQSQGLTKRCMIAAIMRRSISAGLL